MTAHGTIIEGGENCRASGVGIVTTDARKKLT